jgi:hypothetical protein
MESVHKLQAILAVCVTLTIASVAGSIAVAASYGTNHGKHLVRQVQVYAFDK